MFSVKEYREPEHRLCDRLPWAALVAPGVILQKAGIFQKTVAFRGPDLASSLDAELVSAVARLNNALRRLGAGWGFFVEAQREEANTYPSSAWPSRAAWIVDVERRARFLEAAVHYESHCFLTFVWQPPAETNSRVRAFFYGEDGEGANDGRSALRDLHHFEKTVAEIVDIAKAALPEVAPLSDDETLTYLHGTISTNRHPVRRPEVPMYLDAFLPDMALLPGDVPMLGRHYVPTATILGFPPTTVPGILDALHHLAIEYRWVTRFLCLDKADARKALEAYRKKWWQQRKSLFTLIQEEAAREESRLIDHAAANKAADADGALQELDDDLVAFGYLTTTITVWDEDLERALRKLQEVKQAIQSRGFTVKDESLNATEAWLGSLPGNVYPNVRRPIVNTLNLAHMMSVSAVWAGDEKNQHLLHFTGVGTPHVLCNTTGQTPFRLHLNVGDVGHTLILGPTGAGKSTLLGLLALQWLRYPGAQVFFFDKDRSARGVTLAAEGVCYDPGNEHAPVAFQPLARIDDAGERAWASLFIGILLRAQGIDEDHTVRKAVDDALVSLATQPDPTHRTLTVFSGILGSHRRDLRSALRPYTLEGNYGQIFDNGHDDIERHTWTMIEMGHLMALGEEVVLPALEYLFHRVEAQFDGRPTLMIVDEAWLFLGHPVFAGRLQAWLKTLRKKNVYVVFATQEVADALRRPELMSTILSACPTKIFLPDEEALTPAMAEAYQRVGLTTAELELLANAQKKRDYYYRSVKGRRLFQLDLGPATRALVGMSSEDDHRFFDTLAPGEDALAAMLQRRAANGALALLDRIPADLRT